MALSREPSVSAALEWGVGGTSFDSDDGYTMCGFVLMEDVSTFGQTVAHFTDGIGILFHRVNINADEEWEWSDGSTTVTGRTVVAGDWYFWGFISSSEGGSLYSRRITGVPESDLTVEGNPGAPISVEAVNWFHFANSVGGLALDGHMAGIRVWDTTMNREELRQESYFLTPQTNLANLWVWIPLVATVRDDNLIDFGLNNFAVTLSDASDYTVVDGPPVGWQSHDINMPEFAAAPPPPPAVVLMGAQVM